MFVDRVEPLADLGEVFRTAREHGRRAVAVCTGMPGVGKTTLAVRFAHRVAAEFPDGHLFYDLGGSRQAGAAAPDDVLRHFLVQLGVPHQDIPTRLHELAAVFRSHTADRRILVVLDDAATAAVFDNLLPSSPHAGVLVTSRKWLAGPQLVGVHQFEVAPLESAHAEELITLSVGDARLRAEPDAVRDLLRICGGLPLALAVAAGQLVPPRRLVTGIVAKILAGRSLEALGEHDGQSLDAILDMSHGELDPPHGSAYRLLSVHPGPDFAVGAAAALLDRPEHDTRAVLDSLVEAHLLEFSGGDRYRFHPLIARHARDRALAETPAELRWAARDRAVAWYADRAAGLARVLSERWWVAERLTKAKPVFTGSEADGEARLEFEVEADNLLAALDIARDVDSLHREYLVLCEALWPWLDSTDRVEVLAETRQTGLEIARRIGDRAGEMLMLNQLGVAAEKRGDQEAAKALFAESLAIAREIGHVLGQQSNLEWLGLALEQQGFLEEAIEHLARSPVLIDRIEDTGQRERAAKLNRMHRGRMLLKSGRLAEAIEDLSVALTYFTDRDTVNRPRTLHMLGNAHKATGHHRTAAPLLERAAELFGAIRFRSQQAAVLLDLAEVEEALGDHEAVRRHRAEAQRLRDELDG